MSGSSKRGWSKEEDQELQQLVQGQTDDRLRWVEVAKQLHQTYGRNRTGKQCRERWQHQLDPAILREQWTPHEQTTLFSLQTALGNKWALIAEQLPGRTDNAVKNYFYSYVRRILTKINGYLLHQKHRREFRNMREFEADFLSKLMAVVDGSHARKMRLTGHDTPSLAKALLTEILALGCQQGCLRLENTQIDESIDALLRKMHSFRKNCKKRKQKRRDEDGEPPQSHSDGQSDRPSSQQTPLSKSQPQVKSETIAMHNSVGGSRNNPYGWEEKSQIQEQGHFENRRVQQQDVELENLEKDSRSIPRFRQDWSIAEAFPSLLGQDEWWQLKQQKQQSERVPLFHQKQQVEGSRPLDCPHPVSKIKMLQASVALQECLLRAPPQPPASPPQP